jgi:protein-S-isoprenylcysteine O-methyltransferase Ste14
MASGDHARILAPPPLLTLLCVVAGLIAHYFLPLPLMPEGYRIPIGATILLIVLILGVLALGRFGAAGEHPSPYQPTHRLMDTGIYSRTRNPIYLSMLLVMLSSAAFANSAWLLVSGVALFFLLHFGVVKREESYLSEKFGSEYDDYRRRVRRWI